MFKNQGKKIVLGLIAGMTALIIAIGAIAITPINTVAQITSVAQFTDVHPTDWYYQSLQSLIERYGCMAGFPDSTYRPNQDLSRYSLASIMNACMDRLDELIAVVLSDSITKQEVKTLQNLIDELQNEVNLIKDSRPRTKPRI